MVPECPRTSRSQPVLGLLCPSKEIAQDFLMRSENAQMLENPQRQRHVSLGLLTPSQKRAKSDLTLAEGL